MPKLSDFQAILVDVDKTLTNSKREVTSRTQAAIRQLNDTDLLSGVCTGRSKVHIRDVIFPLFASRAVHVLSGGSQVIKNNEEVQWQVTIPAEITKKIIEKAEEFKVSYCFPSENTLFANQRMIDTYPRTGHPLSAPFTLVNETANFNILVMPVLNVNSEFVNFLVELDAVNFKQMRQYDNEVSLDITPKGVNKRTGLKEWSRITGIPLEKVIGVGDSENDDEFLEAVGWSVAMGNATEYLKSKANRVIGHTDEDGLAMYLEEIIKGADL